MKTIANIVNAGVNLIGCATIIVGGSMILAAQTLSYAMFYQIHRK